MDCLQGKGICPGVAAGRIHLVRDNRRMAAGKKVSAKRSDGEMQLDRFRQAKQETLLRLRNLQEKAGKEAGSAGSAIFESYAMILQDDSLTRYIQNQIEANRMTAEAAVYQAQECFAAAFEAMNVESTRAKGGDVRAVCQLVTDCLQTCTEQEEGQPLQEPFLLAAKQLTPCELMQYENGILLGLLTEKENRYSHTVVLAKSLGIPVICDLQLSEDWEGRFACMDGASGVLCLNVDGSGQEDDGRKHREEQRTDTQQARQERAKQKKAAKRRAQPVLLASISEEREINRIVQSKTDGIGLLRSEFLYLRREAFPTEEELTEQYGRIVRQMAGKEVVIRLLDVGADKSASYFGLPCEANPQLGIRGIRYGLAHEEVQKTQLRAILRAAAGANVSVLIPMVTAMWEIHRVSTLLHELHDELVQAGISAGHPRLGVMIETPAAALISDQIGESADFLSIGLNDLLQYTMAADRQNRQTEQYMDLTHPAIQRLVRTIIENGHRTGCKVFLCGELGNDASVIQSWLRLGADALCAAPGVLPFLREIINRME